MTPGTHIHIVGDFDPASTLHHATYSALAHAAAGAPLHIAWVEASAYTSASLHGPDGICVAPGHHAAPDGTRAAIAHARQAGIPLLGMCGGFQHIVLEHARNVLGVADAAHAEYDPEAANLFITPLGCSISGQAMNVLLDEGCLAHIAYDASSATERYYCNYGLNPERVSELEATGLRVVGRGDDGEPRVIERGDHPFFVGTLFVPQARSKPDAPHPLFVAFVEAARRHARSRWLDIDVIQHAIALELGIVPAGTAFREAKPHYWTVSPIGDATVEIIHTLVKLGVLEADEDDETRLRWV